MNTHDIKLPPLLPSVKGCGGTYEDYSSAEMVEYARAAIEADRKRRGEPVYLARYLNGFWQMCSKDRFDFLKDPKYDHVDKWDFLILYTAPQPTEPTSSDPVTESERVYLHDEGYPEYLDGAQCQYVIERGKPYPHGDPVAFVYEKEDAERIVAALNMRAAEPVKVPSKDTIRATFLANGFTIKPGEDDLKPYVYEAAYALLAQCGRQLGPAWEDFPK